LINRSKVVLQGNVNQIRQQYRTYIYRIILEGIIETITSSEQFRVLDQTIINNHTSLHIETINSTANEVIASLLPHYTLLSFEEEIPSMNDIFIRIVKEPLPVI
jgi:ABC-2 type transport system ATP-binding protein